jgi:hypothetical protein
MDAVKQTLPSVQFDYRYLAPGGRVVCGSRLIIRIVGSNPADGFYFILLCVVQVAGSATS